MEFSRPEYWSGQPFPSPGDLPNPGIKPRSPALQADSSPAAATAKSLQSCPTLWGPIDFSPRGSPIPGILQARTLEWVFISFSNAGKWKVRVKSLSHVRLLATPWTAAHQAPSSMGFSRQEYWSGLPLPSPLPLLFTLNFLLFSLYQLSIFPTSLNSLSINFHFNDNSESNHRRMSLFILLYP